MRGLGCITIAIQILAPFMQRVRGAYFLLKTVHTCTSVRACERSNLKETIRHQWEKVRALLLHGHCLKTRHIQAISAVSSAIHHVFALLDRLQGVGCLRHQCCLVRTVDFQNEHRQLKFAFLLDGLPMRFDLYHGRFRQINQASVPLGNNYGFRVAL